jgi:AraC-like DNA-binding protein
MLALFDENFFSDIKYVSMRKCTPEEEIPRQKLEACNFTYIIKGAAQYTINGNTTDLQEGGLLALPKNTVIQGNTLPNQLMQYFSVDFSLFNSQNKEVVLPFPVVSQPGRHEDIIRLFHDLSFCRQYNQPGHTIKARGLFLQILYRFLEIIVYKNEEEITDPRIAKSIRYLSAHFSERITVKMLADMANMHPTYFGILFKKKTGMSFNRYLIQTRVQKAEKMLASGNYRVTNIAEACGFTDISHFYKLFKVVRGFPPSYYIPKNK